MGWTYCHRPKGMSDREFFQKELGGGGQEVLETYSRHNACYAAFKLRDGRVIALIILKHWVPRSYWNFGYRDMDESMNPVKAQCSESILRLLSPPCDDNARKWRDGERDVIGTMRK